jgi:transcription termination factor Rho
MATKKEKTEQLNSLKLKELKALCKERGYEKYTAMNKKEIVKFILKNEEATPVQAKSTKSMRQFRKPSRTLIGF